MRRFLAHWRPQFAPWSVWWWNLYLATFWWPQLCSKWEWWVRRDTPAPRVYREYQAHAWRRCRQRSRRP